ncbi:MAG: hypothetical protein Q9182_001181 [Xanthomendoza sp. 2 TL-2023]
MFASTFISRLTSSTPQPLLPISSTQTLPTPFTDIPQPSFTDTTATLLALARQEAHLQSHIQYLLDVQSDRLLEGLGVDSPAAPSPQTHPYNNDSRPSTKPKPPTLSETRTQLLTAISTLHTLKQQTFTILSASLTHTTTTLTHITSLATKKTSLETTIQNLESSPRATELQHLAIQEQDLSDQILAVENTLFEMRARQRGMRERLREGRNKEDARVSSWRGSLEILEREVGEVVMRKPGGGGVAAADFSSSSSVGTGGRAGGGREEDDNEAGNQERRGARKGGGESVWDLPVKRRTLEMVGEYYNCEQELLRGRVEGIEKEMRALEEGRQVWGDVVDEVGRVEGLLGREMRVLSVLSDGDGGAGQQRRRDEGMTRILDAMALARETVDGKLKLAEAKGWRLLVVCVGAELEALVEGEEVLRGVLDAEDRGFREIVDDDDGVGGRNGDGGDGGRRGGGDNNGVDDVKELDMRDGKALIEDTDDDDDDEPGPDLLMSRQEEDEIGHLGI